MGDRGFTDEMIRNAGDRVLELLDAAELQTENELKGVTVRDPRIQKALAIMKDRIPDMLPEHWRALMTRMSAVLARCSSEHALPYPPSAYICPLGLDWLVDPVVSKYGEAYEREEIIAYVRRTGEDINDRPLKEDELYPCENLKLAVEDFRLNILNFRTFVLGPE